MIAGRCQGCGRPTTPADYYASRKRVCKECVKEAARVNRQANIDRVRAYDRNRPNHDERAERNRERYRKTVADKEAAALMRKSQKEWARRNEEKRKAHIAVRTALRAGVLKVRPCERCGFGIGLSAHHEDYAKPLDVTWLCRRCHGERHREINEERRQKVA